ncbi:MAG TPA: tRNA lysidine(34) synthetase TilS [Tahibacter sp.]|uniref:tRNA lysidine(34) synthetase TilS n=1 Tax=Tahibacter sp. TaxID=2056211 RepID=UPI002BF0E3A5|nr:tRNA lysidine(34) synthetase TilS [Tahibacter sp.]HSX61748.1 tRNA lysidine(34) synthetase TilS [Tahibacter sp.]
MNAAALPDHLESALAALAPGPLCVGYSGGLDSLALLHALASLPAARARGLSAIHVDHGLHADSADWALHCQAVAAGLQLPLRIVRVAVPRASGDGLEAAARAARLDAFRRHLPADAILVLAHHANDQTETVLLKLLRGAGPEGLRGMRALRPLGTHLLWRPLLALPRATLQAYAQAQALQWIDDPSNADTRHARNFLRQAVLPLLRTRWPRLDTTIAHSARWQEAAAAQLDRDAAIALAQLQGLDPATLDWTGWLGLGDALRPLTLRIWLRGLGLPPPEHVHIEQLQQQLRRADDDRNPCVSWSGPDGSNAELRRYRDLVYALAPQPAPPPDWEQRWDGRGTLTLPGGGGTLSLTPPPDAALDLTVRLRRGGERLRPVGHAHSRELRDLLQQAGIPPWLRGRLPIVYGGGELLAVADLWQTARAEALFGGTLQFRPAVPVPPRD